MEDPGSQEYIYGEVSEFRVAMGAEAGDVESDCGTKGCCCINGLTYLVWDMNGLGFGSWAVD